MCISLFLSHKTERVSHVSVPGRIAKKICENIESIMTNTKLNHFKSTTICHKIVYDGIELSKYSDNSKPLDTFRKNNKKVNKRNRLQAYLNQCRDKHPQRLVEYANVVNKKYSFEETCHR